MAITPTYSWPTPDDTDLVKDGAEAIRDLALAIESTVSALGSKRIAAFTASGTWTVPAGVTYAIAHMRGGGGGVGQEGGTSGGNGGDSSVAFAGGTVTGPGNKKSICPGGLGAEATAGAANSSQNAVMRSSATAGASNGGGSIAGYIVAGAAVTPAASITVTVGAGGSAGTNGAAGGSGYVFIEYYE